MKFRRNKKGFTIVELVIVIGVIGILSAILIPTFVSLNAQAEKAKIKSNLHNAFSMYAADAADGLVDKTGAELKQVDQSEAFINTKADQSGSWYVFDADEGDWDLEPTVSGTKTAVATSNPSYLGYYIFY